MEPRKAILLVEGCGTKGSRARRAFDELGLGERIVHTSTASEALMYLRACTTERPRVVLLGVDGSDGGGLDALRAIKEDDQLRSMPVVVLGPPGDTHIVDESFELGAAGYMALSPDSSAFTATIQAVYEYWNLSQLPK